MKKSICLFYLTGKHVYLENVLMLHYNSLNDRNIVKVLFYSVFILQATKRLTPGILVPLSAR